MGKQSKHIYYTPEQEQWIIDNYHNVKSYDELTELFNKQFHVNRSRSSLADKCVKRLGLKGMPNRTVYGIKEKEQLPIGTIRKSQTGTYIKVLEIPNKTMISGYSEPYWMPLQKKIYIDAYGNISKGQMVCFLDGNPENFELDNLYCIDRRISAIMSKNKWWTSSKEHTLTAIKWCELHYALKDEGYI